MAEHPRSHSENEAAPGIVPSHGISINLPDAGHHGRPQPVKHMSAPTYQSPIRHHRRAPSKSKGVKETLNARSHYGSSDDDGAAVHRINQYVIKQEIGRGSFGAVHLAVDQFGHEYAVKEFSKSRLRKRAQSNLLRKPNQGRSPGHLAAGLGFNSPLHRLSSSDKLEQRENNNSLNLIKEEIAIMKKLDHNNLVNLIEALDDPQEDSLYMVLEMCKKGVVMKVGLDERAEPYEEEACRCWFRDMILGIEYLHAQGIIHRDIKPDNCLITDDDVLKIVDFGVSEMFEKQSDMATAKSAGSPAFMPPELCVARHGQVSGRAADIWSMGVTLYCLRYGHIPFEKGGMIELYDSIRHDDVPLEEETNKNFEDLMRRILEKEPDKRITMDELRVHPWVTRGGTDPLLSFDENCADLVDPPTDAEMEHAITGNMAHLLVVMKAVKRFKRLVARKRPHMTKGIFGRDSRLVSPPHSIRTGARSQDSHDRRPVDRVLATEGVHRGVDVNDELQKLPHQLDKMAVREPASIDAETGSGNKHDETKAHYQQRMETADHHPSDDNIAAHREVSSGRAFTFPAQDRAKGHAHDPLTDTLFLGLGAQAGDEHHERDPLHPIVSESPPAVEMKMFEQAYQDEMKRILENRGQDASMYLTRRVDHREDLRSHSNILDSSKERAENVADKFRGLAGKGAGSGGGAGGLSALVKQAQAQGKAHSPASEDSEQEKNTDHSPAPDNRVEGEDREALLERSSQQGGQDESDPPLKAPKSDDASDEETKSAQANDQHKPFQASTFVGTSDQEVGTPEPSLNIAAELDEHKGAMPGMPGGFPLSPGLGHSAE